MIEERYRKMQDWEAIQSCINGNTKEVARELGYRGDNYSLLHKWQEPYGGPNDSGVRNPLGTLKKIMLFALRNDTPEGKALAPMYWFCQSFNHVAVPVGSTDMGVKELTEEFLRLQKESADVTKQFVEKIADGQVSPGEAKAMEKEIWELVRQALLLNATIQEAVF